MGEVHTKKGSAALSRSDPWQQESDLPMQAESTIAVGIDQGAQHPNGSDDNLPQSAPPRSLRQRREALEEANRIRSHRARLKRQVKNGAIAVPDILLDPHEEIETMKVFDLMLAMPKVGRVKANKVLQRTRVSPSKTVGGLSERQRRELVSLLPAQPPRYRRVMEGATA